MCFRGINKKTFFFLFFAGLSSFLKDETESRVKGAKSPEVWIAQFPLLSDGYMG